MKRAVSFLLCVAAVVAFADSVKADVVPFRDRLKFVTQRDGGFVDSSVVVLGAGQHFDTTAAIVNWNIVPPPNSGISTTAFDSLTYLRLDFVPSKNTSVSEAGDTLWFAVQVSYDGSNWLTADATAALNIANYVAVLEFSTFNSWYHQIKTSGTAVGAWAQQRSGTAPSFSTLLGVPLIRFIIQGDMTGEYEAFIHGWRNVVSSQGSPSFSY